jgi:hypothetical protein
MLPARQLVARGARSARRLGGRRGRHPPRHLLPPLPSVNRCSSSSASPATSTSSTPAATSTSRLLCLAPSEAHLSRLAALLAATRQAGDAYCLRGAVGAGKSVFRCGCGCDWTGWGG